MERLAELRDRRALTLRDLSERSGVAADTINQLELGHRKPRPSTIRKLANALGVTPEVLLGKEVGQELLQEQSASAESSGSMWKFANPRLGREIPSPQPDLKASDVQRRLTEEPSEEERVDRILQKVIHANTRDHFKRLDIERWEGGDVPAPDYPHIKSLEMEAADKAFIQSLGTEGIWEFYNDVIRRRREASEQEVEACLHLGEALLRTALVTDRAQAIACQMGEGFTAEPDRGQTEMEKWLRSTLERESP